MFEGADQRIFHLMTAPPNLSGGALSVPLVFAEWAIYIGPALLVLLWVLGDDEDKRATVGACLSALLALAVAAAISSLYFHPRPFTGGLARNYLHHAADNSFPSDHATLLFALGFSFLAVRPAIWRSLWLLPMMLACAVGWARVYLGAHYPLDIAGAALLGLVSAIILITSLGRRTRDAVMSLGVWLYTIPVGFSRLKPPH
jgi:undecaprenyl-diphosphatase